MEGEPTGVTVISDYICPWCYIGAKRVAQLEREFVLDVRWWPFELHPEIPPEGRHVDEIARGSRRAQAYRDHLKSYALEAGIPLASNRMVANSHKALELSEFARDHGAFEAVHDALFHAYFEQARNIGDLGVLCAIATACGLDGDAFRDAAREGRYAELIDRTTAIARERGFASTPTMIIGDEMVIPGAQDYLVYADVLRRMGAQRRPPDSNG